MPGPIVALPALAPGVATQLGIAAGSVGASAGLAALLGGGGSGPSLDVKSIKESLEKFIAKAEATIEKGRGHVTDLSNDYRTRTNRFGRKLWEEVGIENEALMERASALVDAYEGDVYAALESLLSTAEQLNTAYADDMGKMITDYGSLESAIDAQLVQNDRVSEDKYASALNNARNEYSSDSLQTIQDTQDRIFGEDEKFLQRTDQARDSFLTDNRASEGYFTEEGRADLAKREADSRASEEQFRRDMLFNADTLSGNVQSFGDNYLTQMNAALGRSRDETAALRRELASGTPTVDAEAEAARSLAFNENNAARFGQLADTLSRAAQETRMNLLATADPRALELSAIADENAAAMMSGRISTDVQANLARTAAMQALQGGFSGGSMQRNLEARDLGLTSLDFINRGTAMYDAQRRLNYDTRVAGTQVNPFDVMQTSGLSTQQALATATDNAARTQQSRLASAEIGANAINERLRAEGQTFANNLDARRLGAFAATDVRSNAFTNLLDAQRQNIAEIYAQQRNDSLQRFNRRGDVLDTTLDLNYGAAQQSRNTRVAALQDAATQRLSTFDTIFGSRNTEAANIFDKDNRLNAFRTENARDANIRATGMRVGATQDIYNNMWGLADTVFNTRVGTAQQRATVGLGVSDAVYNTNVNTAGKIYDARVNREGNIYSNSVAFERDAMGLMVGALGDVAATEANIPMQQMANRQTAAMQNAQIWGSALSSGTSLAGAFLGSSRGFTPSQRPSYGSGFSPQLNYGSANNDFWLAG